MMAKTIGDQYDAILLKIENAEGVQSYQTSSGEQMTKANLAVLYKERDRILDKIEIYGRNYIDGQNTTPMGDVSLVSFS
jgi:hypothetical protein